LTIYIKSNSVGTRKKTTLIMPKTEPKKISIAQQIRAITNDAIQKLQLVKTEKESREVINKAWRSLKQLVPNKDSFHQRSLSTTLRTHHSRHYYVALSARA